MFIILFNVIRKGHGIIRSVITADGQDIFGARGELFIYVKIMVEISSLVKNIADVYFDLASFPEDLLCKLDIQQWSWVLPDIRNRFISNE